MTNRKIVRMFLALTMLAGLGGQAQAFVKKSINIRVNGASRNMVVFTPDNVAANLPLMIVTHGMNQDPEYQMDSDRMYELVDTEHFVIAYLRSNGSTWDIGGSADRNFVEKAIVEMYTRYDVDPHRVYWTGFSMGSMLMYHSMANMQGKIAAFAPTSGIQFSEQPWTNIKKPLNLIHCHSYKDDVFGYEKYSIRNYVTNIASVNGTSTYTKVENYNPTGYLAGDLETWTSSDGHTVKFFSYYTGGHWPQQPDSKLIWDFCKQYSIADADLDPIEKGEAPGGTYSVDPTSEMTASSTSLDGKTLLVTDDGCEAIWFCNSSVENAQNVRTGSLNDYEENPHCFFTFHKIQSPGCATSGDLYTIQVTDNSGSPYSIWGASGYLNTPPGAWCLFALGITEHKYGQDADYCGLWKVDYESGKGYTIQNVGIKEANGGGGYIYPASGVPVSDKHYLRMFSKLNYKAPMSIEPVADAQVDDNCLFDLCGRKVDKMEPRKIYVSNGRKVIMR